MSLRYLFVCAAAATPLLLGACASSPAQVEAAVAGTAPVANPKTYCLNFTSTKDVSRFDKDQEATYISCVADPGWWAYPVRSANAAQVVIQKRQAIYTQAVEVYDANH